MTGIDDLTELDVKINQLFKPKAFFIVKYVKLLKVKGGWRWIPKRRWGQEIIYTACDPLSRMPISDSHSQEGA